VEGKERSFSKKGASFGGKGVATRKGEGSLGDVAREYAPAPVRQENVSTNTEKGERKGLFD